MSQPTSPTTHYLLIEQPRIAEAPRSTMLMPATELAQMFSRADREAMARGDKVQVGAVSYTDLLAYHDAQEFLKRLAARDKAASLSDIEVTDAMTAAEDRYIANLYARRHARALAQPGTVIGSSDFDWDAREPAAITPGPPLSNGGIVAGGSWLVGEQDHTAQLAPGAGVATYIDKVTPISTHF